MGEKQTQPFVLLIMNCQKYASKAAHQKNTWLKELPSSLIYYHVVGDETLNQEFAFDNEARVLTVKTPDDYCSLPFKVIEAYSAIEKTFDFQFVFKTDDDQALLKPRFWETLIGILETKKPTPHYGGKVIEIKQPYLSEYHRIHPELPPKLPLYKTTYCNGRFYFLSYNSILDLVTKREKIKREYLEDYAIGFHLHNDLKKNILEIKNDDCFKDFPFPSS
jgi:hypothetical protein